MGEGKVLAPKRGLRIHKKGVVGMGESGGGGEGGREVRNFYVMA